MISSSSFTEGTGETVPEAVAADLAVTMEIYANASSAATTEALRRLGESLHDTYCCTSLTARASERPRPNGGRACDLRRPESG